LDCIDLAQRGQKLGGSIVEMTGQQRLKNKTLCRCPTIVNAWDHSIQQWSISCLPHSNSLKEMN